MEENLNTPPGMQPNNNHAAIIEDAIIAPGTDVLVDEEDLRQYFRSGQSIGKGIGAGVAAALIGAGLWAVITVAIKFQIGYMAVGVGFLVGYAIRRFGKGIDKQFGIAGACLALFGCFSGNILSFIFLAAHELNMPALDIVNLVGPGQIIQMYLKDIQFMDIVFYGIAMYEGYKFSIRQITGKDIADYKAMDVRG